MRHKMTHLFAGCVESTKIVPSIILALSYNLSVSVINGHHKEKKHDWEVVGMPSIPALRR